MADGLLLISQGKHKLHEACFPLQSVHVSWVENLCVNGHLEKAHCLHCPHLGITAAPPPHCVYLEEAAP